jgi:hypothetical protein
MQQINPELLEALERSLGKSPRTVYRGIEKKATEHLIDRHLAAILLARECGINVNKYATSDELAEIRGVSPKSSPPVMGDNPTHSKTVLKQADPVKIDLGFITNKKLRYILARDINELNIASAQGLDKLTKTCIILSGSIAEALLLNSLTHRKKAALATATSLPQKPPNNMEEWDLNEMVTVASKMSPPLLPEDTIAGATQLRKWRNLIHPGRELRESRSKNISPTKARARNAIAFLQLIGEQLSKKP